jgi:hypothetical protein
MVVWPHRFFDADATGVQEPPLKSAARVSQAPLTPLATKFAHPYDALNHLREGFDFDEGFYPLLGGKRLRDHGAGNG